MCKVKLFSPLSTPLFIVLAFLLSTIGTPVLAQDSAGDAQKETWSKIPKADEVIKIWDGKRSDDDRKLGEERDINKPTDKRVGGARIIKLTDVAVPELHVYHAKGESRSDSAVIICPGGGYHILAWDLEGTEVAEWLNSIGVSAMVLKYRVPTRKEPRWKMPVQDAQRAISIAKNRAKKWKLNPEKIGILGFSAGGRTAGIAAYTDKRHYEQKDVADGQSCIPSFAILIYPWMLATRDNDEERLVDEIKLTSQSPAAFIVHAFDDPVHPASSLQLAVGLKKVGVPSELHLYDAGGHGYGLRDVKKHPVTTWEDRCKEWMARKGLLK